MVYGKKTSNYFVVLRIIRNFADPLTPFRGRIADE